MSKRLIHLSIAAHAQAVQAGTENPSERYEFSHLPMKMYDGVPVFDSARMSAVQVEETAARLERITGRKMAANLREEVEQYMLAYGRFGLRVMDICDSLSASKRRVLVHLRDLEEAGRISVREEQTRGSGSKRKRYFWCDNQREFGTEDLWVEAGEGEDANLTDLRVATDDWWGQNGDSGIIHHGAAVDGLRCPCSACQYALMEVFDEEERSAARQRGETGFSVGLQARRVRRERAEAQFTKEMQAALVELAALRGGGNDDA